MTRTRLTTAIVVWGIGVLMAGVAAGRGPAQPQTPAPPPLATPSAVDLQHFGIRRLEGTHLTLCTDHPPAPAVDSLPAAFDQAVPRWCQYFEVPLGQAATWHLTGHLIVDRQRFQLAGLLPADLPEFAYGYQRGDTLWLYDQPTDYYRRHLLLHEGTHGFSWRFLGGVGPAWFAEGMAELLATHRWNDGQLQLGYFPAHKEEVPSWGRILLVQQETAARRGLTIAHIISQGAPPPGDNRVYAWSWALAAFLDNHPRYQGPFRQLARQAGTPGGRFAELFEQQWQGQRRELDEQWQLFAMELEYGYDVARAAIEYAAGGPLPAGGAQAEIVADRGWQSSGFRLQVGQPYRVAAVGRYQVAQQPDTWWCEPGGVTLRYWRGQPLGMLMGQVRPDQAASGLTPLARPLPVGLGCILWPERTGTLYLRINDSPAELADNAGKLLVRIEHAAADGGSESPD